MKDAFLRVALALLTFLAGALTGGFLMTHRRVGNSGQAETAEEPRAHVRSPATPTSRTGFTRDLPPGRPPLLGRFSKAQDVERARADLDKLRRRVVELEEAIEFDQGRPVGFPDAIDKIYSKGALVEGLNNAFKEAGVRTEVSAVDCEEFPCVACGLLPQQLGENVDINKDIESLRSTAKTTALSVYQDGERSGTVSTHREDKDGTIVHQSAFCQSFYPKIATAAEKESIEKRVRYRMSSIIQSLR